MKITITIDGLSRDYQGSYYELYNMDWDKPLQDIIHDAVVYEKKEAPEMFAGTMEELDKLSIRE